MEGYFSLNLQPMIKNQLGNEDDDQSTLSLDMDFIPSGVLLQPT